MTDSYSLIKARYAVVIVRTAKESDRATALKLIRGLALDFPPAPSDDPLTIAHRDALAKFYELADALEGERDVGHLWYPAQRAAERWLDAAR